MSTYKTYGNPVWFCVIPPCRTTVTITVKMTATVTVTMAVTMTVAATTTVPVPVTTGPGPFKLSSEASKQGRTHNHECAGLAVS